MKAVACLLIFGLFANIQAYKRPDKSKSVTVALETIVEFDKNDKVHDLKLIDQIQSFFSNVRNHIDQRNFKREFTRRSDGGLTFTEFVVRALDIVRKYDDDDLKNVVRIIDDEARKYHYKGCKFHELLENHDVRRFVANKLNKLKNRPINDIRNDIRNVLQSSGFNDEEKKFIKYVNSLYRNDDMSKFETLLNSLESYSNKNKRTEIDLFKIIKNGLRSIVFDHYSDLKANVRKDFKIKVEAFWMDNKMSNRTYQKKWALKIPNIARTLKITSPKKYTTKNNKRKNKNQLIDAFNNYYDKIDLIKTIKQYIGDINKGESSQETDTATESKNKLKSYKQTSFEVYDIDKKSDFDSVIDKTSHESKKNKNRKKHKRQRKHKSKEKKKNKNKSSESVVSSKKMETQLKRHHKRQKPTQSDINIPLRSQRTKEKLKKQSKLKVTHPIKWREIAMKQNTQMRSLSDKAKIKPFSPVRNDTKRIDVLSSQESLEGNESFKQREIAEVASQEYKSSEPERSKKKKNDNSRKWFMKQMATSDEGISIESYEFVKNHSLSRKANDNDTLRITNDTTKADHLESELKTVNDTIDITKELDINMNEVTYDDLDFWTGSTKFQEITTKVKELTTKIKEPTTIIKEITTKKAHITTKTIVKVNTTNKIARQNDTAKKANLNFLNKTIAFAMPSNIPHDIEDKLEEVTDISNDTLAANTKLVINSYFNESQVLDGDKKHKVRLQIREDINKILGKTVEVTTAHDVMNFTDPLKELEEMDIL